MAASPDDSLDTLIGKFCVRASDETSLAADWLVPTFNFLILHLKLTSSWQKNCYTLTVYILSIFSLVFLVKATNPLVDNPDPVVVASFCAKVNHVTDGAQVASRLLAYRIHSPQEKEALHALAVIIILIWRHSSYNNISFPVYLDSC